MMLGLSWRSTRAVGFHDAVGSSTIAFLPRRNAAQLERPLRTSHLVFRSLHARARDTRPTPAVVSALQLSSRRLSDRPFVHLPHAAQHQSAASLHNGFHQAQPKPAGSIGIRHRSDVSHRGEEQQGPESSPTIPRKAADDDLNAFKATENAAKDTSSHTSSRNLLDRLPVLSHRFHRPTKEELLAAATGFWSRLRVRFKWFTIRSVRPFNLDEISAFVSWFFLGHLVWIILGTTTFFSLLIFTVNTVFAQETLARWVGNYLTKSTGVQVVFEEAIVPKWKDGVISFKNVFVSRRPGGKSKTNFQKGTRTSEQAAAAAAALAGRASGNAVDGQHDDGNYTQFDVAIETINVTLSFSKWFNGRGLLRDVEIKGVRGVIDRTSVRQPDHYIDPRSYKRSHNAGDFEIESFKLDDLLVSVYQPRNFRPFSVSVFSAELPQLRKQWLFYDIMSATHISGSFDDSPFFVHPRQIHNFTGALLQEPGSLDDPRNWKKQSRVRIDGLNIDHLNRGVTGPFSWIHDGNVDIVADIMFPVDDDESIAKIITDFYDRVETTVKDSKYLSPHSYMKRPQLPDSIIRNSSSNAVSEDVTNSDSAKPTRKRNEHEDRFLIMDVRIHLNDVQAAVPIFNTHLSYVNNALIRPIVAYINSNRQFIPINCRVVKRASEFDGSWTIHDSGLMEDLSREAYDAFARDVVDDQQRMRRIKKVGLWSLQLAVQALFLGLAGNMV